MNTKKNGEHMTIAVNINSSGQATIPKAVREKLNIVPGENRLIFDMEGKDVVLKREPSRAEMLDSSMDKVWRKLDAAKRKNPEIAKNVEKYKGMTFEEVRDAYDATPEGRKELYEQYGIRV